MEGLFRRPLLANRNNVLDDAFQIVSHVDGSDPQRHDALLSAPMITELVMLRVAAQLVDKPIDLDRQGRIEAEEI